VFSVVIPLHNKAPHIEAALRGVVAQTLPAAQIIVVDDGSTDGGGALVAATGDPRITLLRQDNAGVSAARNAGAALARHPYIAFLDADDAWMPSHLETLKHLIETCPGAGLYSTLYEIHLNNRVFLPRAAYPSGFVGLVDDFYARLAAGLSLVSSTTACVAQSAFTAAGGFPLDVKRGEDLVLWMRLAGIAPVAHAAVTTAIYNRDAVNRSTARRGAGAPGSLLFIRELLEGGTLRPEDWRSVLMLFDSIAFFTAAGMRELGDFEGLAAIRALARQMGRLTLTAKLAALTIAPSRLLTFSRKFRHREQAQAAPA
jgi:glycosyltransferase involved in cell wall biosynthesis